MRSAVLGVASLILLLPAGSAAAPPNDGFAAAQVLTGESGLVAGTTAEATREAGEPQHGEEGSASVWYRWTAPATAQMSFDTCDSSFDTLLAVYTGSTVGSLERITSSDDACDTQSRALFTAVAGTVYSIAVDGFEGEVGPFTLRWRVRARPANDDFAAAQALPGDIGTVEGTNVDASAEPGEPSHAGSGGRASVWYSWTAGFTGVATFETCTTGFDTTLAVYTGSSPTSLSQVAGNDDACRLASRVTFLAQSGTTYRIAVDSEEENDQGDIRLFWRLLRRVANDDFAAARRIAGARGSITATNAGSHVEAGERAHVQSAPAATVWFRWRAPRRMGIAFSTCGATFDTVLAVYRGASLRRAVRVDGDDDACDPGSRLVFPAHAGVVYSVVVGGYAGDTGTFRLTWGAPPPSARCRVPNVRGRTLAQAAVALERNDCVLGRVVPVPSTIIPRGRVIQQFPLPGASVRALTAVAVEVSRGG
jgi:hypothetical protein